MPYNNQNAIFLWVKVKEVPAILNMKKSTAVLKKGRIEPG